MNARACTLALVAALALLTGGAPARADTTITFDDTAGTITNQYGAQGVTFSHRPDGGQDGQVISTPTPGAHSDGRAARLCGAEEICFPQAWADFSAPHHHVSVYVGVAPDFAPFSGSQKLSLEAYDLSGNLLTQQTADVPNGGPIRTRFTVDSSSDIWFAHVVPVGSFTKDTYIDDLSFDPPPATATPDFGLVSTETGGIVLSSGTSVQSGLLLRRVLGSSGPVSLSVSGMPAGVTATVSPNPVDGPDGTRITLTLRAAADAPPADRFPIRVTGTPSGPSAGPAPRSVQIPLTVGGTVGGFDIRLKGIEVTQGIQQLGVLIPGGDFGNGGSYRGVRLAEGGKTIVRVYADALRPPPGGVPGVGVALRGFAGGHELPGGPLLPIGAPPPLQTGLLPGVFLERLAPTGAFTFVLPPAWTAGNVDLQADVLPPPEPVFRDQRRYVECTDAACRANNRYSLRNVEFTRTRPFTLDVLELKTANSIKEPFPPLASLFRVPLAWVPEGEGKFILRGPRFTVENHDTDLNAQVSKWYRDNPGADAAMGVEDLPPGGGGGKTMDDKTSIASAGRPFTALSHELGHLLNRPHASTGCDGDKGGSTEPWPPDELGYLQGIALDRRGRYDRAGPFDIIATGVTGASYTQAYDIMSYCALSKNGEAGQWLSPHNWEAVFDSLKSQLAVRRRARAAAGPLLHVRVSVVGGNTQISDVSRVAKPTPLPGSNSGLHLIAQGPGGQVADAPLFGKVVHSDPSGDPELVLDGEVPATGVDLLHVVVNGSVLASRLRSANAPSVRVVSPRRGALVRGRNVTVRWSATDADGDRLSEWIDYSRNGGRTWTTIGSDAGTSAMQLPGSLFSRSRRARIRVTASDGFNETSAVSGLFRADGRPPSVQILDPRGRSLRFPADATLVFNAAAMDDRFKRLRGPRLRWFTGRLLIGRGESITLTGALAPGRRSVRVVARDAFGRTGAAAVNLRILAVSPRFLSVRSPTRVSRRAQRLTLRVASSIPARLSVLGSHADVGRRARAVKLRIRRGTIALHVTLRLSAHGRHALTTLTIPRS